MNDTGYLPGGGVGDHLYGFKLVGENWAVSEVTKYNVLYNTPGYGTYACLRMVYTGPEGPIPMPTADAGPDQTGLVAEEIVTLDGSGSSVTEGRSIVSYEWEWDDGDYHRIEDTSATSQTYFSVGSHTVTLTVVSDIGESDTDTCLIEIPSARIPGDIDASDKVDFADFNILKTYYSVQDADL
ncbi:MAG: PKD domain-containing protein [Planctomycetes bacterium]|nr:PKD domain-containing protein [Planctomycetota bacterium]